MNPKIVLGRCDVEYPLTVPACLCKPFSSFRLSLAGHAAIATVVRAYYRRAPVRLF